MKIKDYFRLLLPEVQVTDIYVPYLKPHVVLVSFARRQHLKAVLEKREEFVRAAADFLPGEIETFVEAVEAREQELARERRTTSSTPPSGGGKTSRKRDDSVRGL